MPQIRKANYRHNGKLFVINLMYSNRTNKFYADLPDTFNMPGEDRRIQGTTVNELDNNVSAAISKYLSGNEKIEKYILFSIEGQHPRIEINGKRRQDIHSFTDDRSVGFLFQWEILKSTEYGGELRFHKGNASYRKHELRGTLIHWTSERENAMKVIEQAMIRKVFNVLFLETLKPEQMELFLDQGNSVFLEGDHVNVL